MAELSDVVNLKRWSHVLKGLGNKYAVWEVIYS
jgi:hypothetical protein